MNNLLTICNKRLDTLDNKIALFPEDNWKRKEPPGFEKTPLGWLKPKMTILETMHYA